MAEEQDSQEKTEEPTQRKIDKSIEDGQFLTSKEMFVFTSVFIGLFTLVFISLAAIATNIGSFFSRNSQSLSMLSGVIIIIFGLILFFPNMNQKYFYSANYVDLNRFKSFKNFLLSNVIS